MNLWTRLRELDDRFLKTRWAWLVPGAFVYKVSRYDSAETERIPPAIFLGPVDTLYYNASRKSDPARGPWANAALISSAADPWRLVVLGIASVSAGLLLTVVVGWDDIGPSVGGPGWIYLAGSIARAVQRRSDRRMLAQTAGPPSS